jgi:hypothetical protein
MQSDCVAGGNDSSGDDVVSIHERASDWLANPIDVDRGSSDERDDEAGGGSQEARHHDDAEPADVQAILRRGDPLAEGTPSVRALRAKNSSSH